MDIHSLKNYLINNSDKIESILYAVGFHDVSDKFKNGDEYRCAWDEVGNPTAVSVNKSTLSAKCYSRNIKGDLITLVQAKLNCSFRDALNKITSTINFTPQEQKSYELPFGAFYKKIKKLRDNNYADLETYDESILDNYCIMPSKLFYDDGITLEVQQKYKIGYDIFTDRIVVGWRTLSGELCGIMGRLNRLEVEKDENKWFPIIPFPKGKTLFGYSENYAHIQNDRLVFVGESEKFPMRLEAMGINTGLGLGGSSLNAFQANNIKSLFPKHIIVMLDEGLDEEASVNMAKQLKMDSLYKNNVGYVYDKNGLFLPKGSKMSPADLPYEDMKRLMNHCIKWL